MLLNYIKIALRNLKRNPGFSFINIFGLAIGMSVGMIVIVFLADLSSTDDFHTNKQNIYRITTFRSSPYGTNTFATSPTILGKQAKENIPEIKYLVELTKSGGNIEFKGKEISAQGLFAGSSFFDVFSYELKEGTKNALKEPFSMVVTEELAYKLFDDKDCIGKIVRLEGMGNYQITGIIPDKKEKSHFYFEYLVSFNTIDMLKKQGKYPLNYTFSEDATEAQKEAERARAEWHNFWQNYNYILLDDNASEDEIIMTINSIAAPEYTDLENTELSFSLQAMNSISINSGIMMVNEIGFSIPAFIMWIFIALAFVMVLIAGFNYTNLTVAKALSRAREVGMRKVLGSGRLQISLQYIIEAVIISLIALLLAIGIVELIIPAIKNIDPAVEQIFKLSLNLKIYSLFLVFSIFTGFIAGIFPSLYLSAFKPVDVLKGVLKVKLFAGVTVRKILLTIQFVFGIIFIILSVLLFKQIMIVKNTDLGFETSNRIMISLQGVDEEIYINDIKSNPNILNITATNNLPVVGGWSSSFVRTKEMEDSIKIHDYCGDQYYIKTMGLELISGRNFEAKDKDGHEKLILINESAIPAFNLQDKISALGQLLYVDAYPKRVIGVVKDYYFEDPFSNIEPTIIQYESAYFSKLIIEYFSNDNETLIDFLEEKWNNIEIEKTFKYSFVHDEIGLFYKVLNTLMIIIIYVSVLLTTIACMGLLGMVTFTLQSREKEISIRKIMGADIGRISWILSREFIWIVLIALIIDLPIIFLIMTQIKMLLPLTIGFDIIGVIIGILILGVLVGLTVVLQCMKAARAKPVDALRYE